jgi:hypothetical protein
LVSQQDLNAGLAGALALAVKPGGTPFQELALALVELKPTSIVTARRASFVFMVGFGLVWLDAMLCVHPVQLHPSPNPSK